MLNIIESAISEQSATNVAPPVNVYATPCPTSRKCPQVDSDLVLTWESPPTFNGQDGRNSAGSTPNWQIGVNMASISPGPAPGVSPYSPPGPTMVQSQYPYAAATAIASQYPPSGHTSEPSPYLPPGQTSRASSFPPSSGPPINGALPPSLFAARREKEALTKELIQALDNDDIAKMVTLLGAGADANA